MTVVGEVGYKRLENSPPFTLTNQLVNRAERLPITFSSWIRYVSRLHFDWTKCPMKDIKRIWRKPSS